MMVMEKILLFHLLSLALLGAVVEATRSDDRLINMSQLKMFVDELPDMPKILGFDVVNGVPVSKSLQIGMFSKKWKERGKGYRRPCEWLLVSAFLHSLMRFQSVLEATRTT